MADRKRLSIPQPILVEGRYDKARLASFIDGVILETGGFSIFNKKEKLALFRALAAPAGIIILTDSDGAGSLIRSYLASAIDKEKVYHLYIPQIKGKERRKAAPSKAGTLGVEGMENELLYSLFLPFATGEVLARGGITKADLYGLGLTGTDNAAARRDTVALSLGLPAGMTPGALLGALNVLFSKDECLRRVTATLGEVTK